MFRPRRFHVGERVVFRTTKHSAHPGPRARDVRPESLGEGYQYCVDKYWVVEEVRSGDVVVVTRRGKRHVIHADDPRLRAAAWWEVMVFGDRFPQPDTARLKPSA